MHCILPMHSMHSIYNSFYSYSLHLSLITILYIFLFSPILPGISLFSLPFSLSILTPFYLPHLSLILPFLSLLFCFFLSSPSFLSPSFLSFLSFPSFSVFPFFPLLSLFLARHIRVTATMMRFNNKSLASVGSSKDKDLPPIPSPVASPLASPLASLASPLARNQPSSLSSVMLVTLADSPGPLQHHTHPLSQSKTSQANTPQAMTPQANTPQSKTFTQVNTPQAKTKTFSQANTPQANFTYSKSQYTIDSPLHMLNSPNSQGTSDAPLQTKTLKRKNFKQLSLNSPRDEEPRFEQKSLRQKRGLNHAIPTLDLAPGPSPPPTAHSTMDIAQSNRNIDPDTTSSSSDLIHEFTSLDLSSKHTHKDVAGTGRSGRKRQTVISSISPTKSSAGASPVEAIATASTGVRSMLPVATTSSITLNSTDLVTLKSLGSGNSGTVLKILHLPSQRTMAKKIIPIDLKTVIKTQIIRELKILHECHSPYIIEFYGAFVNNNNTIVICMEYCNCGSLDKILPLCDNKQFPLAVLKKLAFAILSGLTYLYTAHKIIHRDIKPSNVLMTHRGEFKLCDFGVSRELTNSLAMADTFVGTSTYMSPERIQGLNYSVKSDVWSMGLMLIELASGLQVWNDDDDGIEAFSGNGGPEGILDLLQRIVNETAPTLTGKINRKTGAPYDPHLCAFIDLCLLKSDADRKSPWDLLADRDGFLRGVADGAYDKEVRAWAKGIRKVHKDMLEK